jgi:hypothetical protein
LAKLTGFLREQTGGQFQCANSAQQLIVKGTHINCDIEFPLVVPIQITDPHPGVFCDACKKLIGNGCRYKCVTCADIDFCRDCLANNKPTGNPSHDGQKGHPVIELKDSTDVAVLAQLMAANAELKKAQLCMKKAKALLE